MLTQDRNQEISGFQGNPERLPIAVSLSPTAVGPYCPAALVAALLHCQAGDVAALKPCGTCLLGS